MPQADWLPTASDVVDLYFEASGRPTFRAGRENSGEHHPELVAELLRPLLWAPRSQGVLDALYESPSSGRLSRRARLRSLDPRITDAGSLVRSLLRPAEASTAGPSSTMTSTVGRFERAKEMPEYVTALLSARPRAEKLAEQPTCHLYVSAAGRSALPNHTDAHDVMVVHLHGSKQWRVCDNGVREGFGTRVNLRHNCAPISDAEMDALICHTYLLRPGDLLFIPAGYAHSASAGVGGSAHLTLGVEGSISNRAVSRVACTFLWPPALARVLVVAAVVFAGLLAVGVDWRLNQARGGVRRGRPKEA